MVNVIVTNPYRLLGVYANTPLKEQVAHRNRIQAFAKVGKAVTFPLDLPSLLPPPTRTPETIAAAESQLTLPKDQLAFARFWFVKATPIDDIAFNHLTAGNVETAVSLWQKKETASSLQNRIVCALIQENYAEAIACAERLYTDFAENFSRLILGDQHAASDVRPEWEFLDTLCEEVTVARLLPHLSIPDWKDHIKGRGTQPIIDAILAAIETAKAAKGKGSAANLSAGTKLMNDTKPLLQQLQTLLPATDLQYQMVADKLSQAILQCGINYYNDAEESDAPRKAICLFEYATSIAVGQMAKDRCKENEATIREAIANMPPDGVFLEDRAINKALQEFSNQPDKICYAVTLLNTTKPHLQSMRSKLGATNAYYLKMSTLIVNNALINVIEEVNAAQKAYNDCPYMDILRSMDILQSEYKKALRAAWAAMLIIDTFDMDSKFKSSRYRENRTILKSLCDRQAIYTWTTSTQSQKESTTQQEETTTQYYSPQQSSRKVSQKSSHKGCWLGVALFIVAIVSISILEESKDDKKKADDYVQWLYEELMKTNYIMNRSFNDFDQLMRSNEHYRQSIYEIASNRGLYVGEDYASYTDLINCSEWNSSTLKQKSKSSAQETTTKTMSGNPTTTSSTSPSRTTPTKPQQKRSAESQPTSAANSSQDNENKNVGDYVRWLYDELKKSGYKINGSLSYFDQKIRSNVLFRCDIYDTASSRGLYVGENYTSFLNLISLRDWDSSSKTASKSHTKETAGKTSTHSSSTKSQQKVPAYTVVRQHTGGTPYAYFYSERIDNESWNTLTIKNGGDSDAVVFLETMGGGKVRHVYIRKNDNYTMKKIPGGNYIVKIMQGNDWNPEKDNGINAPKGGFMKNLSISQTQRNDPFEFPYSSSREYVNWEITLYKVTNGNLHTKTINQKDLF